MSLRSKTLLGCFAAVMVSVLVPALASAAIAPVLTLSQTSTTAGTSPYSMGYDLKFNPTPASDSPKDVTTVFPAGLLANANLAGGACLTYTTPNSACQIASGTATVGGTTVPAAEYLESPPQASDVAGVGLVIGGSQQAKADVTLRTSPDVGLNVTFANLPNAGLSELNLTLTNLRLPTACPTPPANVTVQADSQQDSTTKSTSAPLTVTGCGSLPYSPQTAATVKRDSSGGAEIVSTLTQAASESASKTIELDLPASLSPNTTADLPCLAVAPCTIGTASATSPLVPAPALAGGTVTLGGSLVQPTITVSFPAPFAFSLVGNVSLTNNSVTFSNVPDLPLTSFSLDVTGPSGQKAFRTSCAPSTLTTKFTAQGGQTKTDVTPITYSGCSIAGPPTASGSLSGLKAGKPALSLRFKHGSGAPNIASVTVRVGSGLSFIRSAVVRVCTRHRKKTTCVTRVRGLTLRGAALKQVQVTPGKLVITLKRAVASFTLTARGRLLAESGGLAKRVRRHKLKTLTVNLRIVDAKRTATAIALKLKAK